MSGRDWKAWDPGDRVEIDSETHPWHGDIGRVVELDDADDAIYAVRLDHGEEVLAYGYELTGAPASPSAASKEENRD